MYWENKKNSAKTKQGSKKIEEEYLEKKARMIYKTTTEKEKRTKNNEVKITVYNIAR